MNPELNAEVSVRRELLHLALRSSTRSVPLQLVAIGVVVFLGVKSGADEQPVRNASMTPQKSNLFTIDTTL